MVDWDTENSDGVECPYCGYTQEDDNPQESGQYSCDECSKTFYVEVEYSATYYSTKPEDRKKEYERNLAEKAQTCESTRRYREANGYL